MSNQFFHTILVVLATTLSASAQTDTVFNSVRQESGALEVQRLETPQEQAFGTHVPSRLMLKATLGDVISPAVGQSNGISIALEGRPLVLGAEYKLTPAWSVGAYYGVHFNVLDRQNGESLLRSGLLQADTRWYYRQSRRIRAGKSANNFSDNYLAAELTGYNTSLEVDENPITSFNRFQWSVRWGAQRRWLKHGYFDFSVGVGRSVIRLGGSTYNETWTTDQRFTIGLAQFLPRKQRAQALDACNVLRCFDEQRSMLKINVYNVLNGQLSNNYKYLSLRPSVAYERKIGRSPFSVEGTVGGNYNVSKYAPSADLTWQWQSMAYNAAVELRWFYQQKRHILSGKSGNNLAGAFLALQSQYEGAATGLFRFEVTPEPNPTTPTTFYTRNTIHLVWGLQRRVLRHGYVQFKTGEGVARATRYEVSEGRVVKKGKLGLEWSTLGELQVGFAF